VELPNSTPQEYALFLFHVHISKSAVKTLLGDLKPYRGGDFHDSKASVLSLTQVTGEGAVYILKELTTLSGITRNTGLKAIWTPPGSPTLWQIWVARLLG